MINTKQHLFETAGLGVAPFRVVRFEVRTYQACHGAPVQPGTSCDFCGTGIKNVYWLAGVDGREFKVGCDCVAKTGDKGLRRLLSSAERRHRAEKAAKKAAEVKASLPRLILCARRVLRGEPHPKAWAAEKGMTRLDWAMWMACNAGAAGHAEVARYCAR